MLLLSSQKSSPLQPLTPPAISHTLRVVDAVEIGSPVVAVTVGSVGVCSSLVVASSEAVVSVCSEVDSDPYKKIQL